MIDGFVACFEFADRLKHLRGVDVMNFEALTDGAEESDGKFAAEMFAEFLKATQNDGLIFGVNMKEFVGEELEAEHFEEA